MYKEITENSFIDAFLKSGRENQFSYDGKIALFEYLQNLEEETGEKMELDVIALCCEFSEYETAMEALQDIGSENEIDIDEDGLDAEEIEEEKEKEALKWLYNQTQVIEFDNGIIISQF